MIDNSFLLPDVHFVLASSSPRRREIVAGVGWRFTVQAADVDETKSPAEPPLEYATRLARAKAEAVAQTLTADAPSRLLVLGADTIVVIDNQVLGKPVDRDDAGAMLRKLSGRQHQVITAVALIDVRSRQTRVGHRQTAVTFARLSEQEINAYLATDEPYDKAGAYAAQGKGCLLIEAIDGDYWNVVGLPVRLVYELARGLMPEQ